MDNILIYLFLTISVGSGYVYTLIDPPSNQLQSSLTRFILVSTYLLGLSYDNLPSTSSGARYIFMFLLSFISWGLILYSKIADIDYESPDFKKVGDLYRIFVFAIAFCNWLFIANKSFNVFQNWIYN